MLTSIERIYYAQHVSDRILTIDKTILPHKRIAELYITNGFNKHGKTELYRELLDHMTVCHTDRFNISPGQRGMVMIVFNLPSDDLVFKLMRDRFDTPKKNDAP